nr:hypothetical protein [bacterium]
DAEGGSSFVARTDSELARYFIAGAFGIGELTDASGLDMTIVEGLRGLYGACLKDEKNCLDSPQARKVSSAWQAILDERERARVAKRALDAKKTEVAGLQQAYEKLVDKVVDRGQLAVGVAPYKSNMPVLPSTMEDFETAGRLLNGMIEVAKAVISSDEKRMEDDRRRAELVHYRAENPSMRVKIKNAMGPYWRFTKAYDAGMKCMPMPRNSEEEYCVEKNKYEMGVWLEWAAREHPEGWRCLEYETKEVLFTKRDSGGATSKTECVRWEPKGRDTSEEEAVSKAMSYCSTTCQ